ncbi:ABC transporter ATP-binding protein [Rhodococcus sp. TAF43]|uniref:ABC transporter ATP-binding protein n=1 Tax=unclassified Rhodococcus (in: high G+C Gram-positive bacteria) TaxID=192944 RepID=UPI000E2DE482|nr:MULTISPECIES: ATP-binding cassette domain-containing protein [unclassified Rhodococcus (in: high G+C Gram-positive bacteria)]RDI18551.1 iron complex transport system ATP-binding protein [Rhodococcus sp. AG1013]
MSTRIHREVVLSAENVDLVRDGRPLLNGIDVQIEQGQHWVLLGANGAGKSTLLSLLGAVAHPTRGTVHVLGHRLGRVDMRELRSHIGHVNPRHVVERPLTVRDIVLTGLTNTPEFAQRWQPTEADRERAEELIAMMGMSERLEARWPVLSQGERGRALIARALMPDPPVLLLDEPATGLDLAAREQLLTALDEMRAQHPSMASILVTHHIEEIPTTTTHAILIRDGVIIAQGSAASVITTERISECFDHPIDILRNGGRYSAQARAPKVGSTA